MNKRKENDTAYLNNELQNLKKIMNSYEDQNAKITELENKLKKQKNNYTRKIKELEDIYLIEIADLNKKINTNEISGFSNTMMTMKKNKFTTNKVNTNMKNEFYYDNVINKFYYFKNIFNPLMI